MTTGLLNGLALSIFVFPIFNFTLWRNATRERVIKNVWELLAILPVVVLLVLAVQSGVDFVLYPLAILSSVGVVVMLSHDQLFDRSSGAGPRGICPDVV